MKRYIFMLFAVLFAALLTGCAGSYVPVYDSTVNALGETVPTLAGYTKDASVLKEREVHNTLRNRDNQIAKTHASSGMKLKFAIVEVKPGVFVQVLEEFTSREQAEFHDELPSAPSVHPVWKTTEKIVETVAHTGLIAFGMSELSGVIKEGYGAVGDKTTYEGDVDHSFNGGNGYSPTVLPSPEAPEITASPLE